MNISFRIKPGRDDLIIQWMENLGAGDRAHYIREALKMYINYGGSNYISLPPPSPLRPINTVCENLKGADRELQDVEKNNDIDPNAAIDEWCDSE